MKFFKKTILTSVIAFSSIMVFAQTQTDAINTYNQARELAQAKDYEAAISAYTNAITIATQLGAEGNDIKERSEKQIPKLYFSKAVESYNAFKSSPSIPNLDAAITNFGEAQEVGAESGDDEVSRRSTGVLAQLHYQKATMLFKREDFAGADASLNNAINTNSNYAKAYYQKGLVHKKLNPEDTDGIIGWFDRAIAVGTQVNDRDVVRQANEASHSELLYKGAKAIEARRNSQAVDLLERSLEYNDTSSDSYYRLAEVSNKTGNTDNAIDYATKALANEQGGSTDKAKIYFELGLAHQVKGDNAKSCEAFKSASYGSFRAPSEHKIEFELKCKSASPSN